MLLQEMLSAQPRSVGKSFERGMAWKRLHVELESRASSWVCTCRSSVANCNKQKSTRHQKHNKSSIPSQCRATTALGTSESESTWPPTAPFTQTWQRSWNSRNSKTWIKHFLVTSLCWPFWYLPACGLQTSPSELSSFFLTQAASNPSTLQPIKQVRFW